MSDRITRIRKRALTLGITGIDSECPAMSYFVDKTENRIAICSNFGMIILTENQLKAVIDEATEILQMYGANR